ncbi:DNA-directed RNA polymerase I subunit RPA49 [Holothuria leucospilota]|uniref:DNA-directed RNA polymerase I subunit RPA49 n=1 Tax=Holothuria leucospilota TaxID=206669 RepID=A0A9Q1BLA3_HOLLE|nr:DNA-directed RNA polymerase I subunit RPA49 [Holothuria leucospilota]
MAASMKRKAFDTSENEAIPIVSFSHGALNVSKEGNGDNLPTFKLLKHSKSDIVKRKQWRILTARGQKIDYVGSNYGELALKASSTSKYMVGVLDKRTGKMQAYDAQLFRLHPWIQRDETQKQKKDDTLTFLEKTHRLTENFGSKRGKRSLNSLIRNKVSQEFIEKAVSEAVENAAVDLPETSDYVQLESEHFQLLPPCNKDASAPADIYKLEDILPLELMDHLDQKGDSLLNASVEEIEKWQKEESCPFYVLDHLPLSDYAFSEDKDLSVKRKAAILAYITVLMQLFITKKRNLESLTMLNEIPLSIKDYIVSKFLQESSTPSGSIKRSLTKLSKDKVMIHILLLALHVDSFRTKLDCLQRDTGIPPKRMLQYVRSFGGKPRLLKKHEMESTDIVGTKKYLMELKGPVDLSPKKVLRQRRSQTR